MTQARPIWVLQEEIGGKAPYIIKKSNRDALLPATITGTNNYYLAAVSANGNKDGVSQVKDIKSRSGQTIM
jgi:hypothetical protein